MGYRVLYFYRLRFRLRISIEILVERLSSDESRSSNETPTGKESFVESRTTLDRKGVPVEVEEIFSVILFTFQMIIWICTYFFSPNKEKRNQPSFVVTYRVFW